MKTRERIVQGSLELFNRHGERSVSTNHIAAHLEISPGNLYYHFANKQAIVSVLFKQYEACVDQFLLPPAHQPEMADLRGYLVRIIATMRDYRFLYRDLEHLLENDEALATEFRAFSRRCMEQGQNILKAFAEAGVLTSDAREIEAMIVNIWIILTSWIRFLCTAHGKATELSDNILNRGAYQVLTLIGGWVTEPWRQALHALADEFYVPLEIPSQHA